ncbi:hypothetical protein BaRGS_00010531 [Batillaria attramentaria]|uniref:Uncharacterized protein n=1 Tax=Batillaria attramentaria TaxID=370345 RepID=A0ABD0LGE5_9CAEN
MGEGRYSPKKAHHHQGSIHTPKKKTNQRLIRMLGSTCPSGLMRIVRLNSHGDFNFHGVLLQNGQVNATVEFKQEEIWPKRAEKLERFFPGHYLQLTHRFAPFGLLAPLS